MSNATAAPLASSAGAAPIRRRAFRWVSSVTGRSRDLEQLEERMAAFYRDGARRAEYQSMVNSEASAQPTTERALRQAIMMRNPQSILEVGCGSGRLYTGLRAHGYQGVYTGLEMSPDVARSNAVASPEASWPCGSIYSAVLPARSFDVVFAYFVLEHCVYPAVALECMISLVRPGGALFLVFPDFVLMGRFPSQALGFVDGRAGELLTQGDFVNACVNFYDARVRLRRALRQAVQRCGPFPVNLRPRCLLDPDHLEPDMDAVYVSSKVEVDNWATSRGLRVSFPAGTADDFRYNALVELHVPDTPTWWAEKTARR